MNKKIIVIWAAVLLLSVVASVAGTAYYFAVTMQGRRKLVVSTTTSLYDTGLLDAIETAFEKKYPIDVYFISVGSGQAIQHATRGDADLILVHAPSSEQTFLTNGYGVCRKIFAYNFFVTVGPAEDPAQIEGLNTTAALTKIVEMGRAGSSSWVSRGDESGTHVKEKELWSKAGFSWTSLKDESNWFFESGSAMGTTLLIGNTKRSYTLADIGTYLAYFKDGKIDLKVFVSQEKVLLNVYSGIAVNPQNVSRVNFDDAITLIKFLVSDECQTLINNFQKEKSGQNLFYQAVNLLKNQTDTIAQWIREAAFFNGTECPPKYQDGHPELYT